MRISLAFLALGALASSLFGAPPAAVLAAPPERHSGTVVAVDPKARSLVIEEMVEEAKTRKLQVEITPQARLTLSERLPDNEVRDLRYPFKDSPIGLSDIRPGDFIVVELTGKGKKAEAGSVTVTFRKGSR